MRLNISVVLLVTLLALTEDIVLPQQPQKIPRIGWIAFGGSRPPRAFMTRLRELGYIEGQNLIIIEHSSAQGREERLPQIAGELVHLNPDVILAESNAATHAVKKATSTIPIVFMDGDPVWDGTVGSLAQPGKNLTGLSDVSFELAGKRLELLREAVSKVSTVAVLLDGGAPVHARQFADMKKVSQALGVQLQALELRDSHNLDVVLRRAITSRANALLMLSNPAVFPYRTRLLEFAAKYRLPAMYPRSAWVDAGGLMSFGVDSRERYQRAAYYVDRILKGAKPSDLPVEQPTKFELVINLKTAKQIGLAIPPKVLMWADRVIE
jgi:putative ABC transport system substrate-binding protein